MKERVPPLDGVRVLVVDDDAIVREVVERRAGEDARQPREETR